MKCVWRLARRPSRLGMRVNGVFMLTDRDAKRHNEPMGMKTADTENREKRTCSRIISDTHSCTSQFLPSLSYTDQKRSKMWQQVVTYPTRCQDRLACWEVLLKKCIVCIVHFKKVIFGRGNPCNQLLEWDSALTYLRASLFALRGCLRAPFSRISVIDQQVGI